MTAVANIERRQIVTATHELTGTMLDLAKRIEEANDACDALTLTRHGREVGVVVSVEEWKRLTGHEEPRTFTVHFSGGPWAGQTTEVDRVIGPVFGAGGDVGNHYWLDSKSDPPTYHWDEKA